MVRCTAAAEVTSLCSTPSCVGVRAVGLVGLQVLSAYPVLVRSTGVKHGALNVFAFRRVSCSERAYVVGDLAV